MLKTYSVVRPARFKGCEARISRKLGVSFRITGARKDTCSTEYYALVGLRELEIFHATEPAFTKTMRHQRINSVRIILQYVFIWLMCINIKARGR